MSFSPLSMRDGASAFRTVTILTGFLGAGKTTFLNALMEYANAVRFAVIENEFGEEHIDGDLLIRADHGLIELSNGCLCCSLNDDLYRVVEQLHAKKDKFDELLIECTGIADPSAVAEPFVVHPVIKAAFPLARVICLVDAELIEDQLEEHEEAAKQLAFSDAIVVNKMDSIHPSYLEKVQDLLKGINPLARVFTGQKGQYPFDEILRVSRSHMPPVFYRPGGAVDLPLSTVMGPQRLTKSHRHTDIGSLSFRFPEPFDAEKLYFRLLQFLMLQAEHVYRVKGVFFCKNHENRLVLQSVGKKLALEEGMAWEPGEPQGSRVVFIGRKLKPEGYERMLRQCLA